MISIIAFLTSTTFEVWLVRFLTLEQNELVVLQNTDADALVSKFTKLSPEHNEFEFPVTLNLNSIVPFWGIPPVIGHSKTLLVVLTVIPGFETAKFETEVTELAT